MGRKAKFFFFFFFVCVCVKSRLQRDKFFETKGKISLLSIAKDPCGEIEGQEKERRRNLKQEHYCLNTKLFISPIENPELSAVSIKKNFFFVSSYYCKNPRF